MNKIIYKVLFVVLIVAVLEIFDRFFKDRKDNPTKNTIYKTVIGIFWTIAAVATVLLYWSGFGYFKAGKTSVAVKLFAFGIFMTVSFGYKIYSFMREKNGRI